MEGSRKVTGKLAGRLREGYKEVARRYGEATGKVTHGKLTGGRRESWEGGGITVKVTGRLREGNGEVTGKVTGRLWKVTER